ncbi:MAG: hypothetical protein JST55_09610 [Bacteroidetes bacterium]|nr:hypothetical protein [Bacteroidota bacterium]
MNKFLLLIIIVFCFLSIDCKAQDIIKFRAKYTSDMEYKHGRWSEWSDWETTNILITIDIVDQRIKIFASSTNVLDIYDYETKESSGSSVLFLYCIDDAGDKCRVRFRYNEDEDDRELYVDYPTFTVAYALKPLSNY